MNETFIIGDIFSEVKFKNTYGDQWKSILIPEYLDELSSYSKSIRVKYLVIKKMPSVKEYKKLFIDRINEIKICPTESELNNIIFNRRSIRHYGSELITQPEISDMLFNCYGVSQLNANGFKRNSPSAGNIHMLEIRIIINPGKTYLLPGSYLYRNNNMDSTGELIMEINRKTLMSELIRKFYGETDWILNSAGMIMISFNNKTWKNKYKRLGRDFALLESGHAAQNILLTISEKNLAGCPVGAFSCSYVRTVLKLHPDLTPCYGIVFGKK